MDITYVRNLPFINGPWFEKKFIEDTMDYVPKDGDIILASYMKTGSTWMQYIMYQIVTKGEVFPKYNDMMSKHFPLGDIFGASVLDQLESPRMYKTHYPYNMVQKNEKSKVVYIYRHPEDTLVSYYHFMGTLRTKFLDFDFVFDCFIKGCLSYGSYFKHVISYWNHRDDKNLLMVSYEKLVKDTRGEIMRIAKFLGEEYYENLKTHKKSLESIVEKTSFDYMKKNLRFTSPPDWKRDGNVFFRKGTFGEGKEVMSQEQLQKLRQTAEEIMKDTDIFGEWYGAESPL